MRILHTADWHLGKIVNEFSMLDLQEEYLNHLMNEIKDINIGGVFLIMNNDETLEVSDKLMLTMDLNEKIIDVDAEVLRVQRNAAGDIEGYGCKFINVSASVEDIVSQYVVEFQRELIQKEAEK